ncbi:MAG TPA: hypothetical protein VIX58_04985 [Anaerolineae bacterium]
MDQSQLAEAQQNAEEAQKKPYEKPAVIFERPLEALAAVCTPTPPGKAPLNCATAFS